jgi:TonB family protein
MKLSTCLRLVCAAVLILGLAGIVPGVSADQNRKAVVNPKPEYPVTARQLGLRGVAKIQVLIAANGRVIDAKILGGHPVLAEAALRAAQNWKFEAASSETTEVLEFRFDSN